MKLGKLQKEWVKSLKENPERQCEGKLGQLLRNNKDYEACCLGELHVVAHKFYTGESYFEDNHCMVEDGGDDGELTHSYRKYGLYSSSGSIKFPHDESIESYPEKFQSIIDSEDLVTANDDGISWVDIGEFIETYPEMIFTKPV